VAKRCHGALFHCKGKGGGTNDQPGSGGVGQKWPDFAEKQKQKNEERAGRIKSKHIRRLVHWNPMLFLRKGKNSNSRKEQRGRNPRGKTREKTEALWGQVGKGTVWGQEKNIPSQLGKKNRTAAK